MGYTGARLGAGDLETLLDRLGYDADSPTRGVLRLRLVEGYGFAAVAAELGIKEFNARKRVSRFKARLQALRVRERDAVWVSERVEELREAESAIGGGCDAVEQAEVILESVRGPRKSCPPTPEWDENGRRVGGGATLVSKHGLARYIRAKDRARAQGSEELQHPGPL